MRVSYLYKETICPGNRIFLIINQINRIREDWSFCYNCIHKGLLCDLREVILFSKEIEGEYGMLYLLEEV